MPSGRAGPPDGSPSKTDFSAREIEIYALLGQNLTVAEIADHLCLSPKTIEVYFDRMVIKRGLERTRDLRYQAIEDDVLRRHGLPPVCRKLAT